MTEPHGIWQCQVGYQADRIESVKLIIRSWCDLQHKQDGVSPDTFKMA